jgi:caffeoyl-CoA O-methyltransferase
LDFLSYEIENYAKAHTSTEPDLLKRIDRETHAEVLMPRMVSGHLQGRFLSMVSHMIKPNSILEIGTYTGYSAICLAEGLSPNGRLITIDINEELETRVRGYFKEGGLEKRIDYHIGDAAQIISTLNFNFDLVFIDADKENYGLYYDLVFDKVPVGGFILADNVLWSGKVVQAKVDKDTKAIKEFNQKVNQDTRVKTMLLPLRDGIMIVQKIRI